MSNIPKGTQKPQTKGQIPPNIRQQGPRLPPNLQRPPQQGVPSSPGPKNQINPLNARGKDASFVQMSESIRNMATNIRALQKENAELKAKLQQTSQP